MARAAIHNAKRIATAVKGSGCKKPVSIRRRLFLSMFLFSAFTITLFFLGVLLLNSHSSLTMNSEAFERVATQFNHLIDIKNHELQQILFSLALDEDVARLFTNNVIDPYDQYFTYRNVDRTLRTLHAYHQPLKISFIFLKTMTAYTNAQGYNATIYDDNSARNAMWGVTTYASLPIEAEALMKTEWYRRIEASASLVHALDDFDLPSVPSPATMFTEMYHYKRGSGSLGYIAISVSSDWLDPIFKSDDNIDGIGVVVRGIAGNMIYCTDDTPPALLSFSNYEMDKTVFSQVDGESYIVKRQPSKTQGFELLFYRSARSLIDGFILTIGVYLSLAIVFIFITYLLSTRLAGNISAPIIRIAEQIERKHPSAEIRIEHTDGVTTETAMLAQLINRQTLRITELVSNLMDSKLLYKEAQINALKQQINPHFVYNVIETMSSIALIEGCHEVRKICESFGDNLRYALNKDSEQTTLSDELNHLRQYLSIFMIKNGNFTWNMDIDPTAMGALMPRLSLQPLAENCLLHAFTKPGSHGVIEIAVRRSGDNLSIEIRDNGAGIPPEKLDSIRQSLIHKPNAGIHPSIGLSNVHWRIRLNYGEPYGLSIKSELEKGTRVLAELPFLIMEDA